MASETAPPSGVRAPGGRQALLVEPVARLVDHAEEAAAQVVLLPKRPVMRTSPGSMPVQKGCVERSRRPRAEVDAHGSRATARAKLTLPLHGERPTAGDSSTAAALLDARRTSGARSRAQLGEAAASRAAIVAPGSKSSSSAS